jgi:hypothetical protein
LHMSAQSGQLQDSLISPTFSHGWQLENSRALVRLKRVRSEPAYKSFSGSGHRSPRTTPDGDHQPARKLLFTRRTDILGPAAPSTRRRLNAKPEPEPRIARRPAASHNLRGGPQAKRL